MHRILLLLAFLATVALGQDCPCEDAAPDDMFSCEEQRGFGQCNADWMAGFCLCTCETCGEMAPMVVSGEDLPVLAPPIEESEDADSAIGLMLDDAVSEDRVPVASLANTEGGCRAALLPVIRRAEELAVLSGAIEQSDLVELLTDNETEATLFAPTNEAFEAVLVKLGVSLEDLVADVGVLSALLRYHIVPDVALMPSDLERSRSLATALPEFDLVSGSASEIEGLASTAGFVGDVVQVCGSVIYLVDEVLLPEPSVDALTGSFSAAPEPSPDADADAVTCREGFNAFFAISSDDSLSTFASLLNLVQLSGPLAEERRPFTVFAPTNRAFERILDRLGMTLEDLQQDQELLEGILRYHIIRGENWEASELPSGRVETWNTSTIVIEVDGSVVLSGIGSGASVTDPDIDFSCVSAVHKINGVLLPFRSGTVSEGTSRAGRRGSETSGGSCQVGSRNFFQVLSSTPGLTIWAQIIQLAGMRGIFSDKSISVTMFAPNDAAFGVLLPPNVGFSQLVPDEALARVLVSYHTVSGAALRRQIEAGMNVETLLENAKGKALKISLEDNPFGIIDLQIDAKASLANFVTTDIIGCNSVIHIIDTVLLPYRDFFPSESVDVDEAVEKAEGFDSVLLEANEATMDDTEDDPPRRGGRS